MSGLELPAALAGLLDGSDRGRATEALGRLCARGRAAHPELTPSHESVGIVLAAMLDAPTDIAQALDECDAGEVWLAAGCHEQSGAAQRLLDELYIAPLDAALATTRIDALQLAEVKQRVRLKLLGVDDSGSLRVARYAGRGRLVAMAKVIALRTAVDMGRVAGRHPERAVSGDAEAAERLVDGQLGPELAAMDDEQRRVLKTAFEQAVGELEPLDRGVLRMHVVEQLSLDEIAAFHNVHRATAARWLGRTRDRLAALTRAVLQRRHGLAERDVTSFLALARSGIDLSLSRVLGWDGDGD